MGNIKAELYGSLNIMIEGELKKVNPNTELINECVDGLLRLMPGSAYQITAKHREEEIKSIIKNMPGRNTRKKFIKIICVAAIIIALLAGTALAYTITQYNIYDYSTYSEVWANITSKKLDKPVEIGYIPKGFELVEEINYKELSYKIYYNGDIYLEVDKSVLAKQEINTEYGKEHKVILDNIEYIVYGGEKGHGRGVLWYYNNYEYLVYGLFSEEDLLKIAVTVR